MAEFDKIDRFRQSFEKGQKGKVSSFDIWLREKEIEPEKATMKSISQYFKENPERTSNHQEPFEKIAEFAGFFFEKKGNYHISVIGVSKVGRTQFLNMLEYAFRQLEENINPRYYDAASFYERTEEEGEQHFYKVLDEISGLEAAIISIDNCEKDKRIEASVKEIKEAVSDSLIITSWTPEAWNKEQDRIKEIIPPSKELRLTPFGIKDTITTLQKILEFISKNGPEFKKDFFEKIHDRSEGIPGLSVRLLLESLKEAFLKELEIGDPETVKFAAENLGLEDMRERLENLSDQHLTILKHILLSYDPRGMTPSEIVEVLNRDKATVSYHLQKLMSKKILTSEKQGRNTFYKIREEVRPLIQLRLEKESEYYG